MLAEGIFPFLLPLSQWITQGKILNERPVSDGKDSCCHALSLTLGNKVYFPSTSAYQSSLVSYFSQQEEQIMPHCIVSPTSTADVSDVLTILHGLSKPNDGHSSCKFAIRSGGHTAFAGAANIKDGVTIDMSRMNSVDVSDDKSTTKVGPGATWGSVYLKLDVMGLAVAGGRAAQVGVGGLTIGGGISYFSPRTGLVCDTVKNFEVVLANGSIVNANAHENPDLLVALRGGSNNFGVVTRVDLTTFEQGNLWGGSIYYDISTVSQQLKAFEGFNLGTPGYDEFSSLIMSFGFAGGQGAAIVNNLEYTKPVVNPPVFQPFTDIPQLFSTMRIANLTNIAIEQGAFQGNGLRQLTITSTYASKLEILTATFNLWNVSLSTIKSVPGVVWSISLEPLPPAITSKAAATGGNSLGLDPSSGPLVVCLLSATWLQASDDDLMDRTARQLFHDIDKEARDTGTFSEYKYLNYAANSQDPIKGYGKASGEFLKRVSSKYDPTGVFQKDVPGGFKL